MHPMVWCKASQSGDPETFGSSLGCDIGLRWDIESFLQITGLSDL